MSDIIVRLSTTVSINNDLMHWTDRDVKARVLRGRAARLERLLIAQPVGICPNGRDLTWMYETQRTRKYHPGRGFGVRVMLSGKASDLLVRHILALPPHLQPSPSYMMMLIIKWAQERSEIT